MPSKLIYLPNNVFRYAIPKTDIAVHASPLQSFSVTQKVPGRSHDVNAADVRKRLEQKVDMNLEARKSPPKPHALGSYRASKQRGKINRFASLPDFDFSPHSHRSSRSQSTRAWGLSLHLEPKKRAAARKIFQAIRTVGIIEYGSWVFMAKKPDVVPLGYGGDTFRE